MIDFSSDLAKLNDKLFVFSEDMFDLLENCANS